MKKALYLECSSGISGDMSVAALISLGVDQSKLLETLQTLPLEGYQIEIKNINKSGIIACDFHVILDPVYDNHDHDMKYLHESFDMEKSHSKSTHEHYDEEHDHPKSTHEHYDEEHDHSKSSHKHYSVEHDHSKSSYEHTNANHVYHRHEHRNLADVLEILRSSSMTSGALFLSEKIFQILAQGEALAHGIPLEEVHFHEVGAVDSIVDIAAFSICFDMLGYQNIFIPSLCDGSGTIRCQHGLLPVPVPAVANIISKYQIPLSLLPIRGELVTPTGAAIAASIATSYSLPKSFTISHIGIGAGKRLYETPGILRAMEISYEA